MDDSIRSGLDLRSPLPAATRQAGFSFAYAHKVDKASLDIQAGELNLDLVADLDSRLPTHQHSLGRRLQQPNPGSFFGGTGDKGIEGLSNPAGRNFAGRL